MHLLWLYQFPANYRSWRSCKLVATCNRLSSAGRRIREKDIADIEPPKILRSTPSVPKYKMF
jgi:hypothetical protein